MGATKPFPISTYLPAVIPPHLFLGGWGCKNLLVLFRGPIFQHLRATQTEQLFTASIGTNLSLFSLWGANVGWRPNYDLGAIIGA